MFKMEVNKKIKIISLIYIFSFIVVIVFAVGGFIFANLMTIAFWYLYLIPLILLIPIYLIGIKASIDLLKRKSWARVFLIVEGIFITLLLVFLAFFSLAVLFSVGGDMLLLLPLFLLLPFLYSSYQLMFNKEIRRVFKKSK